MLNYKNCALRLAGTVFAIVAIIHLLRIITDVAVFIGTCLLPIWVNWIGMIAATVFSIMLLYLSSIKK